MLRYVFSQVCSATPISSPRLSRPGPAAPLRGLRLDPPLFDGRRCRRWCTCRSELSSGVASAPVMEPPVSVGGALSRGTRRAVWPPPLLSRRVITDQAGRLRYTRPVSPRQPLPHAAPARSAIVLPGRRISRMAAPEARHPRLPRVTGAAKQPD